MKHRLLAISIYFLEATWMIIRQILKLRNPVVWNPPMNKVSRSLMAVDSGRCKSKTASIGSLSFSERTICLRFDNMPKIKLSKVFLAEIKYSIYYCINLIDGTLLSSITFKYTCIQVGLVVVRVSEISTFFKLALNLQTSLVPYSGTIIE